MAVRIDNVRLIDPAGGQDTQTTVLLENGSLMTGSANVTAAEVVNGAGLWLVPGFVDLCARLREPGNKMHGGVASEGRAARAGGVLDVVVPPDTQPTLDSGALITQLLERAQQAGNVRVHAVGALTKGLEGKALSNMARLVKAGCIGVGNARAPLVSAETTLRCLEYAATLGVTVFFSPEEPSLARGCAHDDFMAARLGLGGISSAAETVALATQLLLVEQTGVKAHFGQLSCRGSVELIRIAKDKGLNVTADVAMHHLHLTDAAIDGFNSMAHVRPPLRSEDDRTALREGVKSGILDAICSDHQPLDASAKLAPFSSTEPGMSTLETLLPLGLELVRDGVLTETELLRALTGNPARVIGLEKPSGWVLVDPAAPWTVTAETLLSVGKNTPWLGHAMQGRVLRVFN
ncbi:MAG: aspartate carbamoyltransferase [Moraxellaceae bacterium]|jgi:dihydroorotase|nr:aspartate carbamoyltransferase [Moraxellaceae bacterium]